MPDLSHTGVARQTQPHDRHFFYPNGSKNRALGATIHSALYGAGSSHGLNWAPPPSFQAGGNTYPSGPEPTGMMTSGAVPAGQGGLTPCDVWDAPRVMGSNLSRGQTMTPNRNRERKSAFKSSRDFREASQLTEQAKDRLGPPGLSQPRGQNQSQPQEQPMGRQTKSHNKAHRSLSASRRVDKVPSGTPDWICKPIEVGNEGRPNDGPVAVDARGRDAECATERRTARREAEEVLGAVRRNNSRLWVLVGGSV